MQETTHLPNHLPATGNLRKMTKLLLRGQLLPLILISAVSVFSQSNQAVEKVVSLAHAKGNFDGVVILSQNGKPTSVIAAGYSNRATKTPNKPDTVFRLASLTKQITALLIMQQVSGGKIQLDAIAGGFLKTLPAASARVTVRQLLQHVSGLPNPSDGPDNAVPAFYLRQSPDAANMTETALGFCSGTPKREPGTKFEYNNCDYIILGALLESLAGKTYSEIVGERVIQPLGLKSWGIFTGDAKLDPVTALGYQEDGMQESPQNVSTYGSSGALYGNALDVVKWNEALLSHRLLSAEATQAMFRADPKLYGEALGSWAYDLPLTKPPLHVVERQGDIGSTRLLNLLLPEKNASLIIIANTDRADLFNTYSQKGLGYEVLKAWLTF